MTARIFCVDDEPDTLTYVCSLVEKLGHKVIGRAFNGTEAVPQILALRPAVVISDYRMPGKSGVELAKDVNQVASIPFILATGYHDDQTIEEARKSPVVAYIHKPLREFDVKSAIVMAIEVGARLETQRIELENTKIQDRARRILMRAFNYKEEDAETYLMRVARNDHKSMLEACREVILRERVKYK